MRSLARSCSLVLAVVAALAASRPAAAKPLRGRHAKRMHERMRPAHHDADRGQSIGVPWDGELRDAARLPDGDGYHIRRPARAYGTRTTVDFVERVIADVRDEFPHVHELAIGDLSARHGGPITEHHSHQSGRDADIGLIYKHQPPGYPASFVRATAANLDCAATYALVRGFARTSHADGGVQIMFLDYDVQGLLYRWATSHGVASATLSRIFQYPRGRSASALVHHWPNHETHLHVRFKCTHSDPACH